MAGPGSVTVTIVADAAALAECAADLVVESFRETDRRGQRFSLVLAGGSTPEAAYRLLAVPPRRDAIDWQQTDVWFGDERCVAPGADGSNYRMVRAALLDRVPVAASNVHRIRGELGSAEAARIYAAEILRLAGKPPSFTMVLLGMGSDGHTASLFPDSAALDETTEMAVAAEGPPPHRKRVTLTHAAFARARNVVFLVAGAGKASRAAEAIAQVRGEAPATLPAARVRPEGGTLTWLLDRAAATDLPDA